MDLRHNSFYSSLLIIILLGSCVPNSGNSDYDEETITKAEQTAKSYIENNYQDIDSIELEEPHQSPMGSLVMEGTVNKIHGFTISLNGDFKVTSVGENDGFPKLKEECKEQVCDY